MPFFKKRKNKPLLNQKNKIGYYVSEANHSKTVKAELLLMLGVVKITLTPFVAAYYRIGNFLGSAEQSAYHQEP